MLDSYVFILISYHLIHTDKKNRRAWRNSETAKSLADFLVICSYVNKLKIAFASWRNLFLSFGVAFVKPCAELFRYRLFMLAYFGKQGFTYCVHIAQQTKSNLHFVHIRTSLGQSLCLVCRCACLINAYQYLHKR